MCIGVSDISVFEMASAYTAFVKGGMAVRPVFVTRIEDENGNIMASGEGGEYGNQTNYTSTYCLDEG